MDLLHYHLLAAYDVKAAGQTLGRGGALAHELSVEVVDVGVVLPGVQENHEDGFEAGSKDHQTNLWDKWDE